MTPPPPIRHMYLRLLMVFVCLSALTCSAQTSNCISVRVLNEKTGKPIRGVQVRMAWVVAEDSMYVDIGKTGKQGTARYCLPIPTPSSFRLYFYVFSGPDEREEFDTEAVMKHGLIGKHPPDGPKLKHIPDPRPGEVLIFGERWWLIDRWLGPWP